MLTASDYAVVHRLLSRESARALSVACWAALRAWRCGWACLRLEPALGLASLTPRPLLGFVALRKLELFDCALRDGALFADLRAPLQELWFVRCHLRVWPDDRRPPRGYAQRERRAALRFCARWPASLRKLGLLESHTVALDLELSHLVQLQELTVCSTTVRASTLAHLRALPCRTKRLSRLLTAPSA